VFLTGVAGTGKSFLLNSLKDKEELGNVALTASTGIAALNIGGTTLHRWSGVGIAKTWAEVNRKRMGYIYDRIGEYDTLIIDEISMIDAGTLNLVSKVCKGVGNQSQPFGHLRVIFVGDMAQLPPVEEERGFAFESPPWVDARPYVARLVTAHRQSSQDFVNLLNRARVGEVSHQDTELLQRRVNSFDKEQIDKATRLMSTNAEVDSINMQRLTALPGETYYCDAQEYGNANNLQFLDKNCLSPRRLIFKIGARVMFTKNGEGYANGEVGTIRDLGSFHIGVEKDNGMYIEVLRKSWEIEEDSHRGEKEVVAARTQFPLKLAYAITIHKSQGMSLDLVSVNLFKCFTYGQAYVALSRARTLEGLNLEGWPGAGCVKMHPKVREWELQNVGT
jgi:ATP-dependent exoDNAse (exonuclease V) alpha subunit